MSKTPIEELLKRCPSAYKLVVVAAQRAKELSDGAPKLVETDAKKVTSMALQEICDGKVGYHLDEPEKTSAKAKSSKRAGRSAERKKKS